MSAQPTLSLPFGYARRNGVLVQSVNQLEEEKANILFFQALTPAVLAEVRRFCDKPLHCTQVSKADFDAALAATYEKDSSAAMQMVEDMGDDMDLSRLAESVPETEDLLEQEDDAPIIRLINALLTEAVKHNASDIHIESFEKYLAVRYRIDGVLREMVRPKRALAPLLVSRIKVMAKLDIAEKRIPQDGRISLLVANREVDIRVSTMPSNAGERVVLRLLDKQAGRLDLSHLGMGDADLVRMHDIIKQPHGVILVTGPTGSGKTTTLYAALTQLNDTSRNILTVEDPIEYNLSGIGQTQVNLKADMTFARGLRAMLRQDPDVVMVGEIRDLETAQIAVQASLTGHMVLSTLHTNSAVGALTRLQDMGIEPFLLSSSLVGVLAQRLVRVLCENCKEAHTASVSECESLRVSEQNPPTLYRAKGCDHCSEQGYRGRCGIYELIVIDETLREMIHNKNAYQEIEAYARTRGAGIREDGRAKVLQGVTTFEEVLRVTLED